MKKIVITNGYAKKGDSKLFTFGSQVYKGVNLNVNFPDPIPTVEEMDGILLAYMDAIKSCKNGDRLNIAIKNQKKDILVNALHKWAEYVSFKSAGDVAVAISSNFNVRKTPTPTPPLQKPLTYRLEQGMNPGELVSICSKVNYAVSYTHQYATAEMMATNTWVSITSSKTKCVLPGLQRGTEYFGRVLVLGTKGQRVYSDIASKIVD
jgi:hypothetical protein